MGVFRSDLMSYVIGHRSVTSSCASPKDDSASNLSLQPKHTTHMQMNGRTGVFAAFGVNAAILHGVRPEHPTEGTNTHKM